MPKSMRGVMKEFGSGQLHSGSSAGPVVKNRKQAIAIGLSEQRQMGKKAGRDTESSLPHPHRNLGKFLHPRNSKKRDVESSSY